MLGQIDLLSLNVDELKEKLKSIEIQNEYIAMENEIFTDYIKRNNILSELAEIESTTSLIGQRNPLKRLFTNFIFERLYFI